MTLTIKNATFINGKKQSITLKDGKLLNIGTEIKELGKVINLPEDTYVSTGWIDIHTHAYPKFEPYCAKPDAIGYETGVATVVDAGSTGAKDFNSFLKNAHHVKTDFRTRSSGCRLYR